jgi:ribonuclease HI
MEETVKIWTDGSANNKNHNKGGFGVVIKYKDEVREYYGGRYDQTTSSRMEILAVIRALETVKPNFKVIIHSDLEYLVKAFNCGWLKGWSEDYFQTCKNPDLWSHMWKLYNSFPKGNVKFIHVRGHKGIIENEMCDILAKAGAEMKEIHLDNRDIVDKKIFIRLNA